MTAFIMSILPLIQLIALNYNSQGTMNILPKVHFLHFLLCLILRLLFHFFKNVYFGFSHIHHTFAHMYGSSWHLNMLYQLYLISASFHSFTQSATFSKHAHVFIQLHFSYN